MKLRRGTVRERIISLEIAVGSQKKLAESLGVSTRTIRRWKHVTEREPKLLRKFSDTKIRRRERYYTRERFKDFDVPVGKNSIHINDFIHLEALADLAHEFDVRYPKVLKQILTDRPNITMTVLVNEVPSGGQVILVPGPTPEDFERLTTGPMAMNVTTHQLSRKYYESLQDLLRWFWQVFRKLNPEGKS